VAAAAGSVNNWLVLGGVILTFLTALLAFIQSRLNTVKIQEVHVMVNSNLTHLMGQLGVSTDRNVQLESALKDSSIPIPEKPLGTGNPA
jgi:hypothetical protein